MLDERKQRILQAIIEDFVATAEPIGSRTIARKMNMVISAATIRNEMADLEHLGYLEQPHTSAGRIPSAKGYRFYVDCLMSPTDLSDKEIALIKKWYEDRTRAVNEVYQETVRILSHMTHNVSLMIAKKDSRDIFNYVEFLPLDDHRLIMLIVGKNGVLENRIIEVGVNVNIDDVRRLAGALNKELHGRRVSEIRADSVIDINRMVLPDVSVFESFLNSMRDIAKQGSSERLYLGGTTQLLSHPEFREMDRVRNLMNMLDEQRLMCDILHCDERNGTLITIGQENKFSGIRDCSIVQADFKFDDETTGKIAVLGPTRMHYGKVISTLDFMSRYLADLVKRYTN